MAKTDPDADFGAEPTAPATDDGSIKADDYSAPGIHLDKSNNMFTRAVNEASGIENDVLFVPNRQRRLAEGFYQYFEKIDFVPLAVSRGFRPVSRKDAGFATVAGLPPEYGLDSGDVPHRIHDLVLMEGPIEVYNAIEADRQATARAAIQPILKTAKQVEEEPVTGNKVEDYREASFTAARIRELKKE